MLTTTITNPPHATTEMAEDMYSVADMFSLKSPNEKKRATDKKRTKDKNRTNEMKPTNEKKRSSSKAETDRVETGHVEKKPRLFHEGGLLS